MAQVKRHRREKGTGRIFRRKLKRPDETVSFSKKYYLAYTVNGKKKTICLDCENERDAKSKASALLDPVKEAGTKEQIAVHIAEARNIISKSKVKLDDVWELVAYGIGSSSNWQDYDPNNGSTNLFPDVGTFKCSSFSSGNATNGRISNFLGDYGFNYKHVFFAAPYLQKITSFNNLSGTLAGVDAYMTSTKTTNFYAHCNSPSSGWTYGADAQFDSRHTGNSANVFFLDGHANSETYTILYNNVDDIWGHDDPVLPNHGPDQ